MNKLLLNVSSISFDIEQEHQNSKLKIIYETDIYGTYAYSSPALYKFRKDYITKLN